MSAASLPTDPAVRFTPEYFWPALTEGECDPLDNESFLIAERRTRVAAAYCRGLSMREVAKEVSTTEKSISFSTVRDDLQAVFRGWQKVAIRSRGEQIARELMLLAHREADIEREWEKSKGERVEQYAERREGKTPSTGTKLKKIQGVGDPRLAALLLQCWDRRCRLLGLLEAADLRKNPEVAPTAKLIAGVDPVEAV